MSRAAFQGTFADFKLIKSRKVGQFVIEIPLEQADAALSALGGLPRPDQEAWVAVARLDPKAAQTPAPSPAKPKSKWDELPYAQQAALRCNDVRFRSYLEVENKLRTVSETDAAAIVRRYCQVESRAEIVKGTKAGDWWEQLDGEFGDHLASNQYAEYAR